MLPGGRLPAVIAALWCLIFGAWPLVRLLAEGVTAPPAIAAALVADDAVWAAAGRSLIAATLSALLAAAIGGFGAVFLLLADLPARRLLTPLFVLPLLVPPQVLALAAAQALAPAGALRLWFGLPGPFGAGNPLYGPGGIVLLLGVSAAPVVFLATAALARRLPAALTEAARGLGAAPRGVLLHVVLPLLAPGVAAGAAVAFVAALGNFGIPAILGTPARWTVLTVLVWQRLTGPGAAALAQAALLALVLALLACLGLLLARLLRQAGRPPPAGRPAPPLSLGVWRWPVLVLLAVYLGLVLALPVLALVATAYAPALGRAPELGWEATVQLVQRLARQSSVVEAFRNSLLLALGAGAILALLAPLLALLTRAKRLAPLTALVELPYALPGTVTAVAAILVVLALPFGAGPALYGSIGLIMLAYLSRFAALALRPMGAALDALDPRLAEAAAGLGAGPLARLRHVFLPMLLPALVAGAALVALTAVNEVTISALLYAAGSRTLGVLVFGLNEGGETRLAASVSLLSLALVALLMGAVTLAGRHLPPGAVPWRA